ncbi:hypothetical protein Anas_02042, partial [Armadillidium nasatum]
GSAPVKHNVSTLNGSTSRLGASTSRSRSLSRLNTSGPSGIPNTKRSRTSSTTSLSSNHSASKIPILR